MVYLIIIGIIFVLVVVVWWYVAIKYVSSESISPRPISPNRDAISLTIKQQCLIKKHKCLHILFVSILVILAMAFILVGWFSLHTEKSNEIRIVITVFLSGLVAIIANRLYPIVNALFALTKSGRDIIKDEVWAGFYYTIAMIVAALIMILYIMWE